MLSRFSNILSSKNQGCSTRSRSANAAPRQEPHSAGTHAHKNGKAGKTHAQGHKPGLSPAHAPQLPSTRGKPKASVQNIVNKERTPVNQNYAQNITSQKDKGKRIKAHSNAPGKGTVDNSVNLQPPLPVRPSPVSDNTVLNKDDNDHSQEGEGTFDFSQSKPGDPWHKTYKHLEFLMARMGKLDRIDESTARIAVDLEGLVSKIANIERDVRSNTNDIQGIKDDLTSFKSAVGNDLTANNEKTHALGEEIAALRALVEKQGKEIASLKQSQSQVKDQGREIASLKRLNTNVQESVKQHVDDSSQKYIKEMTDLILAQREQVESFHSTKDAFQRTLTKEVDEKVGQVSRDLTFDAIRRQAFDNRQNLVITGLQENDAHPFGAVKDFINKTLGIPRVSINEVYRIGRQPDPDSQYCRPIVIKFRTLADRNQVWRNRTPITSEDSSSTIRIKADLPRALRDHLPIMYRIQKAASTMPDYKTAVVRNYQIVLHGKEYPPQRLEHLPAPLRPSSISAPRSQNALAFFSKYTVLSNHYLADFKVQRLRFHSVEQFLAFRRAKLSGQQFYIQKALRAKTPVEAKSILHALKEDHVTEWDQQVQAVGEEGVRAKFLQNPELRQSLLDTKNLRLGEASRNPRWGVGMNLDDPDILDVSKWSATGNLLGSTLMKIREEIRQDQNNSSMIQEPDQC